MKHYETVKLTWLHLRGCNCGWHCWVARRWRESNAPNARWTTCSKQRLFSFCKSVEWVWNVCKVNLPNWSKLLLPAVPGTCASNSRAESECMLVTWPEIDIQHVNVLGDEESMTYTRWYSLIFNDIHVYDWYPSITMKYMACFGNLWQLLPKA